jgi:hypothetical protein
MHHLRGVVHHLRHSKDKTKDTDTDTEQDQKRGSGSRESTGSHGSDGSQKSRGSEGAADAERTFLYARLEDAVPYMQTGDLLLQSGDGARLDRFSRMLQFSSFTHVLMLVRAPPAELVEKHQRLMTPLPALTQTVDTEDLFVFEASSHGVMLRPLWHFTAEAQERANEHRRNFPLLWRSISNPGKPYPAKATDYPGLLRVLDESAGIEYEKHLRQFILGWMDRVKKDDHSSIFCSELVTWALREMELLPPTTVTANSMPGHYADEKTDYMNQKLRWGPAQYQGMVRLKYQDADYRNSRGLVHRALHAERFLETQRQTAPRRLNGRLTRG